MVEPHINRKKRIEESHNLSEKQNVMDDITHGQWSKNYYNEDYDNNDHDYIQNNEDMLDPYTMQRSFRKIVNKLSKRL
jgi:hypothetical protein